ncbi:unnamed protein product [Gemmata massiliana]|uniref:Cytochrome c domain-containing protein n=1 Tax=Gemmata massiliana TaxID=1210884 RepID=A0A6P2D1W9_9BACT|nr:hypothetical protein [Gemmata massiliana]VTR94576.1 unnamed protein product [Gemmata massiliana]
MKKACPCLTALALALFVSAIPSPTPAAPTSPAESFVLETAPGPHDRVQPYAHTAIGAVIEANGWKVPATGTELTTALAKIGNFVQLPVTFSAVALNSGLSHPRVVITMRPSSQPGMVAQASGGLGWSGSRGSTRLVAGTPASLGDAAANRAYLEGRLFLAANTETGESGPVVKTVEFISWNGRKQKFDFGVIEGMGEKPELKILDGTRCFSCHKNKGPILGVAPWSNTTFNESVRTSSASLFKFAPVKNQEGKEDPALGRRSDIDGLRLLESSGPEVDAAVRLGADVLRDRERFRLLAQSADGRKALVMLLSAIAARDPLDKLDKPLKIELNRLDLIAFLQQAHAANKALAPSALADFNPARPLNKVVTAKGLDTATNPVTKYDALRATGEHGLPSLHQPSNPKAFLRPNTPAPQTPAQLVSAVALARAIGLSEGDRAFLVKTLDAATRRVGRTDVTPAIIAKKVFTGASFADVMKEGVLPERDDFKDRFVAGVVEVTASYQAGAQFWEARSFYASAPERDPNAKSEKEIVALPSHACATCHDFRTVPKPAAFSPIPVLAFDPLDATARDNWLKTASRKQRQDVLGRLLKRVDKDKDMPPEDSVEAELYRVKDPTAISALKEWLDAELKKAK